MVVNKVGKAFLASSNIEKEVIGSGSSGFFRVFAKSKQLKITLVKSGIAFDE